MIGPLTPSSLGARQNPSLPRGPEEQAGKDRGSAARHTFGVVLLGRVLDARTTETVLLLVGAVTVVGALFNASLLRSWVPGTTAVSSGAAMSVLLLALAMRAFRKRHRATLLGSATAVVVLSGINLLDAWRTSALHVNSLSPWLFDVDSGLGMTVPASISLFLLALGLLDRAREQRSWFGGFVGVLVLMLNLEMAFASLSGLPNGIADDVTVAGTLVAAWTALFLISGLKRHEGGRETYVAPLVACAISVVGAAVLLDAATHREIGKARDLVEGSFRIKEELGKLGASVVGLQDSARAYALTGEDRYLDIMSDDRREAKDHLRLLGLLLEKNPAQRQRLVSVVSLVGRVSALLERSSEARRLEGANAALAVFVGDRADTMRQFSMLLDELASVEDRVLQQHRVHSEAMELKSSVVSFGSTGSGFVLIAIAMLVLRAGRRQLAALNTELEASVERRAGQLHAANALLEEQNRRLIAAEQSAREGEQHLRTVLANSPVALWMVNRDGIYTLREGKALFSMGHSPGQGVGLPQEDVMPDYPELTLHTRRALAGESFSAETTYRGCWFNNRYAPFRDSSGNVVGVVGVSTDITARKQAEQLAIREESARQASRMKTEFLAKMSHEIRTPMNGVVGMTSLLGQTELTPDQQEMVGVVQSSANVLLAVINDILDYSKIEAGKLPIVPAPFDLRLLVEEMLAPMGQMAAEKHVELLNDFDPAMPTALIGDAVRIRQILTNLLGNAMKFTPAGHVAVRVRPRHQPPGRLIVRIEVSDTGIGIAHEAQGALFEPFAQAELSTARRFGGTGLGLAICKQLVSLMGGSIGVSSAAGKGSTFWFELNLPLAQAGTPVLEPATFPRAMRVLIVDDCEANASIVAGELAAMGIRADTACDANVAVSAALARTVTGTRYAAILVDRFIGQTDGLEFAKMLRSTASVAATPLILLSPFLAPTPEEKVARPLFQTRLSKPVRRAQLYRAIRASANVENPANEPVQTEVSSSAHSPGKQLHVLLAEDNVVNQRVARLMLEKIGHRVDIASNGEQALSMITANDHYDAVLMDCHMPILDGFEATRRLRSIENGGRRVKVIALTASSTSEDRQKCLDAGMDDFVPKPVKITDLIKALAA